MKTKLCLTVLLSFIFCLLSSQVPQGFNYQAIARDGLGNPIVNTGLPVTITIKTDSTAGIIIWEELHTSVTTNGFGLFTLVVGNGSRMTSSNVAYFKDIDWSVSPKFIKTQILHQSQLLDMGTTRFWSVPYSMAAGSLTGTVDKLNVKGKTNVMDEALFEVKNKDGQTIFAVYNEGVRVYVADGAKGNTKGGFAIGGFGTDKGISQNYLTVSHDSIRAYVNDTIAKGVTKGGFAIGGFGTAKGQGQEYLRVTPDSTRIYVDNSVAKGVTKGGFAIGGFGTAKEAKDEYLRVTSDSVKVSKSLLIPRLTTYERDHLTFTPGDALIIFNMTEGCMQIFKNNVWSNIWCFNCAPAFIIQPVDNTICSGNNVTIFVSATGTSLSYQWQVSSDNGNSWNNISNGGASPWISGANGYSLSLANIPVGFHNYKFRCIVAGSCLPNVTSNAVTLNVGSAPPVVSSQPVDQQLSGSCTASFNVVSPGYGVTYKWQQSINGGSSWTNISDGGSSPVFSGATTATLSLTNVPIPYNNNKYRCVVSNSCGTDATSGAATLTIIPASIVAQPVNQQLTTDCYASFNITTPGGYAVSYQWQASSNGGNTWFDISDGGTSPVYSGATASTVVLNNVPLTYNNYKFRCVASSLCGPNETSTAATLTVDTSSPITIQPVNKLVYAGQNITFSISASGSGINYQWQESTNGGSTWLNLNNGGSEPAYTGVNTSILAISKVPEVYDNYKYRCNVSHYCRPTVISDAATLAVPTPIMVTDIDGNTCNSVGIGSQLWMAENLKSTRYNDGTVIPNIADNTAWAAFITGAFCDYSNTPAVSATYGRLYNWYAVDNNEATKAESNGGKNVCPTGWHVPSDAEWSTLINYLGGDGFAGGKLKEIGTSHWGSPNTGATNETGFTALPGGYRYYNGVYNLVGDWGFWWSSTEYSTAEAWGTYMSSNGAGVGRSYTYSKHYGYSVRCLKDPGK